MNKIEFKKIISNILHISIMFSVLALALSISISAKTTYINPASGYNLSINNTIYITESGNVGIGKTLNLSEKLTLEGGNFLQNSGNPVHKGSITDDGDMELSGPRRIYVSGKYAYVTGFDDDGVEILDISDPTSPKHVGKFNDSDDANAELDGAAGIYVSGKYAYVASNVDDGVEILDVSSPSNITHVGFITDTATTELDGALGIYVSGKYAYVTGSTDDGVEILDVSDPSSPKHAGSITDAGATELDTANGIYVSGKYAYVASQGDDGVEILDVSDPSNPTHVGKFNDSDDPNAELDGARRIYVSGKYAYVASFDDDGVEILNISNPSNITHVGFITDTATTELNGAVGIYVSGKYAYVTGSADDGVEILDVSDPSSPKHAGSITDDATTALFGANGIYVSGKYAYVAGSSDNGVEILDIPGIDAPTASIGDIAASSIKVWDNVDIGNNLYVRNGINIGSGGILSDGPVSLYNKSLTINNIGNVGIGIWNATAKLHINGSSGILFRITGTVGVGDTCNWSNSDDGVNCTGLDADYAELYSSSEELEAGDVVVIDGENEEFIRKSFKPFDTKVLGVVSTRPAITIEEHSIVAMGLDYVQDPLKPPVALAGRIPVKVTSENGFVEKGDLLTTSSKEGYAMKCSVYEIEDEDSWETIREKVKMNEKCLNSALGKALESCYKEKCKILTLTT